YTQGGQRLRDGNNTTMIFDGAGDQVVSQNNANLGNVNLQNMSCPGTGLNRQVLWLNNPSLVDGFQVVGDTTTGAQARFILQDNVATGGIGTTAANTFRIENGATAQFEGGYTCASTILFRNAVDGTPSDGVPRLLGTIGTFAASLTSGIGT